MHPLIDKYMKPTMKGIQLTQPKRQVEISAALLGVLFLLGYGLFLPSIVDGFGFFILLYVLLKGDSKKWQR